MKDKPKRLNAIRIIIANGHIGCQEELQQKLQEQGFDVTQATLSRDLKQLKVAKTAAYDGSYVYVLPQNPMHRRQHIPQENPTQGGFVSLNFSSNIAVIKTRPGYASGIAYDIDSHDLPSVLGTVAGDDTVFLVIKEGQSHSEVRHQLSVIIPEMK